MPETEEPILNVVGKKVAFGPHRRDLLPLYTRWLNDFEVTRHLSLGNHPMTVEAEEKWYETALSYRYAFCLYALNPLRPIGTVGLHDVDHRHGTAEFGIFIGDKTCWGKGCGTEATALMLEYAFATLGLHNVMLRVHGDNERAIRAYTRAGFREIGRRRESLRVLGQVVDMVYMDCLATEFQREA